MRILESNEIQFASGGGGVSAETVGCAIGGAVVGSLGGGPFAGAAGCIAGGAAANTLVGMNGSDWMNYIERVFRTRIRD